MVMPCCCWTTKRVAQGNGMEHLVFLGLGSNMGDRRQTLCRAYERIEELVGSIVAQSAFYESEPWGFVSDHTFLNSVICCSTARSPRAVLWFTQQIEWELGRRQKSVAGIYHDRPVDIDILLYDCQRIVQPDLVIPHPQMLRRDFVLRPLIEVFQSLSASDNSDLCKTIFNL